MEPSGLNQSARVLAALECGIAVFDRSQRIRFWNPWLEQASGILTAQAVGNTLEDLFGTRVSTHLVGAVQGACQSGFSAVLSHQLHRRPLPLFRKGVREVDEMEQSILIRPLTRTPEDADSLACVMQVTDVTSAVRRERHLRDNQAELRLRTQAIEASTQGIVIADARSPGLPVIYANASFHKMFPGSGETRTLLPLDPDPSNFDAVESLSRAIRDQREATAILSCRCGTHQRDGEWVELSVSPVKNGSGTLTHYLGVLRDITARRNAEAARDEALRDQRQTNARLSQEKRFISTVLQTVGALVTVLDRKGRIVSFNRACELITGIGEDEARGQRLTRYIPDSDALLAFNLEGSPGVSGGAPFTTGLVSVSGDIRRIRWTTTVLPGADGMLPHLICTGIDVTEQERAQALLQAEREILELVARSQDLEKVMARLCTAFEEQAQETRAALLLLGEDGKYLFPFAAPNLPEIFLNTKGGIRISPTADTSSRAVYTGEAVYSADIDLEAAWASHRDTAREVGIRACWAVPVRSSSGAVLGCFSAYRRRPGLPSAREVGVLELAARLASVAIERARTEERIRHLAMYDQTTGLANRVLLSDHLQGAINHAQRHGEHLALLFIDLDGFKAINDTHGHDAGDEILAAIGQRLRERVRGSDTAARIGGDEFVILLTSVTGEAAARQVAEDILACISAPTEWHGESLRVGGSIGLSLFPEDGQTADALLTRADDAMYAAKQAGKGRVHRLTSR